MVQARKDQPPVRRPEGSGLEWMYIDCYPHLTRLIPAQQRHLIYNRTLRYRWTRATCLTYIMFLVGYVLGPTVCGPLSESFGRKTVMQYSFFAFTIFTICCVVAPSWTSLLFFPFACGMTTSVPMACTAGIFSRRVQ